MGERRDQPSDVQRGWEAHRRERLDLNLAATPAQRLAWLEEAIALAYLTGAFPRKERGSSD